MRTFVTDGQTDRQTDGADYIGPAGPVGRVQKVPIPWLNFLQNAQNLIFWQIFVRKLEISVTFIVWNLILCLNYELA